MRTFVSVIAGGVIGLLLWGVSPAAAESSSTSTPVPQVRAEIEHSSPPTLIAHTAMPMPVIAAQPPLPPAVVAQSGFARAITPEGSQPGVLWLIAIGAVLCRLGARVVRLS